MYARVQAESIVHYWKCLLFLAINRKRLCLTLSSVDNSITVLLFGCLVLLGFFRKTKKLHERSLYLCDNNYSSSYDELLSKQDLVNIHVRIIQQLMIEIFKCLKGISPPIMNEIFRLKNISIYHKKSEGSQ